MTEAITWVEIDIPEWTPNSPDVTETYTFAMESMFFPSTLTAIQSIKNISFQPAILSLGQDLGQRGSVTITFKDHRHSFNGESFDSGTFWGKFRARYGLTLRGYDLRVIHGTTMAHAIETRHYVIERTDGPKANGEYTIVAKDLLKFADGDRAQAPKLSNGFLQSDITAGATTATLLPSGIGNAEYPTTGTAAIGGTEIVFFARTGDSITTMTRGQGGTTAVAHEDGDRFQLCVNIQGQDVADIIFFLLTEYADVPAANIPLTSWQAETAAFLGTVYTSIIGEPTSVNKLVSELIEQAGLVLWWDDFNQLIRLQVIRAVSTDADSFDQSTTLSGSLAPTEQPEKRLSQVYFYFGKINYLVKEDQIDNYRSTALTIDEEAEASYGGPAIKKIFSRWVPTGGRTIAQTASQNMLSRFRDPPRRFEFDLLRYSVATPALGAGYQLQGWMLQNQDGTAETVPVQVISINPNIDRYEVTAEEMLFTGVAPASPDQHNVIIDANINNVNLKTMHDSIYASSPSGTTVTCSIYQGVTIGSTSLATPAFDVGTWGAGVTIQIINLGRIQGMGGTGGTGGFGLNAQSGIGSAGVKGGTAFYTRQTISAFNNTNGQIWGGGGGGGGGGGVSSGSAGYGGGGGGGGSGTLGGVGGAAGFGSTQSGNAGFTGTSSAGSLGGASVAGSGGGGIGGNPGAAGGTGGSSGTAIGGGGGAAGNSTDGTSFITFTGTGSILGPQI